MRPTSAEPPATDITERLLGTGPAAEGRPSSPAGPIPQLGRARRVSVVAMVVGVALLWVVPLGGALLVASAGLGLAIGWEGQEAHD